MCTRRRAGHCGAAGADAAVTRPTSAIGRPAGLGGCCSRENGRVDVLVYNAGSVRHNQLVRFKDGQLAKQMPKPTSTW